MNKNDIDRIFEYVARSDEQCGNELIYAITLLHSCIEKSMEIVKDQIVTATVENRFDELAELGQYCKGIGEIEKQIVDCNSALCMLSDEKIIPQDVRNIRYKDNGRIDYASYRVNAKEKHSLTEDFTFRKVGGFSFRGEDYKATTWKDVTMKLAEILYKIDPQKMVGFTADPEMNGQTIPFFSHRASFDQEDAALTEQINGTNIYIYIKQSANSLVRLIKKMLLEY